MQQVCDTSPPLYSCLASLQALFAKAAAGAKLEPLIREHTKLLKVAGPVSGLCRLAVHFVQAGGTTCADWRYNFRTLAAGHSQLCLQVLRCRWKVWSLLHVARRAYVCFGR